MPLKPLVLTARDGLKCLVGNIETLQPIVIRSPCDMYLVTEASIRDVSCGSPAIFNLAIHQELDSQTHLVARCTVRRQSEQLTGLATQCAEGGAQISINKVREQPQRIEQVALAGPVRSYDNLKWTKLDNELIKSLESIQFHSGNQ